MIIWGLWSSRRMLRMLLGIIGTIMILILAVRIAVNSLPRFTHQPTFRAKRPKSLSKRWTYHLPARIAIVIKILGRSVCSVMLVAPTRKVTVRAQHLLLEVSTVQVSAMTSSKPKELTWETRDCSRAPVWITSQLWLSVPMVRLSWKITMEWGNSLLYLFNSRCLWRRERIWLTKRWRNVTPILSQVRDIWMGLRYHSAISTIITFRLVSMLWRGSDRPVLVGFQSPVLICKT